MGPGVELAHYGSVRGIDAWRECDACVSVGDPVPELGQARERAAVFAIAAVTDGVIRAVTENQAWWRSAVPTNAHP